MSYFPKFSNFKSHVQTQLNARRGNMLEVSKLNVWVRLTSGVGAGLVVDSNPNYNLFRAAGQGTGIYDGAGGTATIGTNWNGGSVSAGMGGRLRPRPVVTSVEVDEGAGNISRKATISITAFSKEQMEKVCEYFLEPGYTVFLEFGWNTNLAAGQLTPTTVTDISSMQDFNHVNTKRANSNGQYENYLGYITGGGVSVDGSNWTISVNLTGFTELPFYLQPGPKTKVEKEAEKKGSKTFGAIDVFITQDVSQKRFKQFYNALASERRTSVVKGFIKDTSVVSLENFINFDDDIKDELNSKTEGTKLFGITLNNEEARTNGSVVEFEAGTRIVGDERFVRLEVLMKVLSAASITGFKIGNKTVNINFDISNTVIGAFPKIFSLDKSKLFIPNRNTPKFSIKAAIDGVQEDGVVDNTVQGTGYKVNFPAQRARVSTEPGGSTKPAQYWGYLKDLYVNIDFFNSIVGTKNFAIKDVLYNLLNGLSSSVNSYWNFQIIESPAVDGVINLEIVDLNFTSQDDGNNIYEFILSGEQSIFIENSFDMDISGQMMNKIIASRLSTDISTQKDSPQIGFFTKEPDLILNNINKIRLADDEVNKTPEQLAAAAAEADTAAANTEKAATERTFLERVGDSAKKVVNAVGGDVELSEGGQALSEAEEAKKARLSEFLGLVGMYPKVEYTHKSKIGDGDIETYIYRGIYNDSNLLNAQREDRSGNQEYSPLLPIKFSFTIHGISGIQRGDKFKVNGIPNTFYTNGFFQVTSIKHIVDGMMWKTQVEGSFRNSL